VVVEFVAGVESGLDLVAWRPYGFGREMVRADAVLPEQDVPPPLGVGLGVVGAEVGAAGLRAFERAPAAPAPTTSTRRRSVSYSTGSGDGLSAVRVVLFTSKRGAIAT
jgi:hypothetical protein